MWWCWVQAMDWNVSLEAEVSNLMVVDGVFSDRCEDTYAVTI